MDGSGDSFVQDVGAGGQQINQIPQLPVLLVDGHDDMGGDGSGEMSLAQRMDELSTDDIDMILMVGENLSPSSERFEKIIGAIEEIVVGDEFQALQNHFLSTYWTQFSENHPQQIENSNAELGGAAEADDSEENHFKIFQSYSQDMAHLLESQLKIAFHDEQFDFTQFVEEFSKRVERNSTTENDSENNMFESEIFEMLFTLTDFVKFTELFMDYKEMMEGKTPNLSTGITLKPLPVSPRYYLP